MTIWNLHLAKFHRISTKSYEKYFLKRDFVKIGYFV